MHCKNELNIECKFNVVAYSEDKRICSKFDFNTSIHQIAGMV